MYVHHGEGRTASYTFGGLQLDLDRIVLIPQSKKDFYAIGQPYLSTNLIDKLDSHAHKVKQQREGGRVVG